MDDYLTKPVRSHAIAEALERWVPLEPSAPGPTASPAGAEPRALDPERFAALRELHRGDGELLAALIREYLEEGTALLMTLREAIAEGDPQTVERAAHTLAAASANIGALGVAEVCAKLESFARAAALGTAPQLVDRATTAFDRVRGELAAEASTI
jgi:HPt (histidine-containing phosphotransfer) domain-containing protein